MDGIFPEGYKIPDGFVRTSEMYEPKDENAKPDLRNYTPATPQLNPQTTKFCERLKITDPMAAIMSAHGFEVSSVSSPPTSPQNWTFIDESEMNVTQTNETTINLDESQFEERKIKCDVDEENKDGSAENVSDESRLKEQQFKRDVDEENKDDSAENVSDANEGIEANYGTPVSAKKFKRRNIAIYSTSECNDDE